MEATTEQWKTFGDCKTCRRQSYCRQACKAHRNRIDASMRKQLEKITGLDVIQQAMDEGTIIK